jgi:hypothetical protein
MAEGGDLACVEDGERRLGGPAGAVRFSREVAGAICARLASGESLRGICSGPGMPHRSSVMAWMRKMPKFQEKVDAARAASGWHSVVGGRRSTWCEVTAQIVFTRMLAGESLTKICDDPQMPGYVTLWNWRRRHPDFDQALSLARESQAERLADKGMEIADGVTPQTAHAVKVQLAHLRWTAGAWMPGRYGRVKPADPPKPPPQPKRVAFKTFHIEERADGWHRVATFAPDPETGRAVRLLPNPPWEPPIRAIAAGGALARPGVTHGEPRELAEPGGGAEAAFDVTPGPVEARDERDYGG